MKGKTIWVVYGERGDYSDYSMWLVGATEDWRQAERWIKELEALDDKHDKNRWDENTYTREKMTLGEGRWSRYVWDRTRSVKVLR